MARRAAIIAGVVAVGLPVLAYGGLSLLLRDSFLRPRVVAAVEEATGRKLTLAGPIGIKLSLLPTVTLEGVALSNRAGGSRPEMLTARRVEARLALLPLLSSRLALDRVTLIEPDLLLERDGQGQGNWRMASPTPASASAPEASRPSLREGRSAPFSIGTVEVEGGRVTWRDAARGTTEVLDIRHFGFRSGDGTGPIAYDGQLGWRGMDVALGGTAGSLRRLLGVTGEPDAWPLELAVTAPGIRLGVEGSVAQPETMRQWRVRLDASVDQADRLRPFLPSKPVPPFQGLSVQAELADGGPGAPPVPQGLTAQIASGDLSPWLPGLTLGAARLEAPGAGAETRVSAALQFRGLPLQAAVALPPLPVLLSRDPWPFQARLQGQGLAAQAEGSLPGPRLEGATAQFSATASDTAPLLSAFALPAPRLTEARLSARLALPARQLAVEELRLQSREASLNGSLQIQFGGPRPASRWTLAAERADLDAILAPVPRPAPAPAAQAASAAPPVPARPPVPAPAQARRVIPDLPLPLGSLRQLDSEGRFSVGALRFRGVDYRALEGRASLAGGKLAVNPLGISMPGGRILASFSADGAVAPGRFALVARHDGGGLDIRPLLQGFGLPAQGSGLLELDADLSGSGADLRSLAAGLSGHFGLAMANGQIDNRLLDRIGGDLRRLMLPNAPAEGGTALRCLALRLHVKDGIARPQAMLLETGLADVVGSGEIHLGEEKLALRLLPQVRIGGIGLTAPVLVGGSFAAPSYRLDQARVPEAAAGILGELAARQQESGDTLLGQLAQQLAGRPAGSLPDCAQQLAVARGGRSGPVPAAPAQGSASPPKPPNPLDLLRGLFGR